MKAKFAIINTTSELAKTIALGLLQAYKRIFSPLLPPACRFVPSCSEYAAEAIERFGMVRGAGLALWRLLRCHPFTHGGYDPVIQHDHQISGLPLAR